VGFDHLDLEALKARGIKVISRGPSYFPEYELNDGSFLGMKLRTCSEILFPRKTKSTPGANPTTSEFTTTTPALA
jgi:hypothetical protein